MPVGAYYACAIPGPGARVVAWEEVFWSGFCDAGTCRGIVPAICWPLEESAELMSQLPSVMPGSLCGHKLMSSLLLLTLSLLVPPSSILGGRTPPAECGSECLVCLTRPGLVSLYQSAGSASFWLINVQFEIYYEPPGFNYYTITQSIPCHFIFMAFIMPLYVQLPNFILEGFHLISWVLYHSSHLSRLLFISVPGVCFLLCSLR